MLLINLFTVGLIWIVDLLDRLRDPFEDFTRLACPKYLETLATKAAKFEVDLQSFKLRDGTIYNYRIPQDDRLPLDLGDQSLWHGVATAMFALKGDLPTVKQCLIGIMHQQPGGRLIRGIGPDNQIQDDASNDQATGHLLGLYMAWKYGDREARDIAGLLMEDWAANIYEHGHALVHRNGQSTTYGRLIQGYKTDPLRLTLCLAIYAAAWAMAGKRCFSKAGSALCDKYHLLIPYAKVKLWSWDTVYDTHRAAIHYYILNDLGIAPRQVGKGIRRLRKLTRKHGNIWINCLLGVQDRKTALKVLSEFTLEDKQYNTGRVNSDMEKTKFKWGGEWVSRQPLPRWRVSAQDFFWQRNLYSLDFRGQGDFPDSRLNGLDYLAAYWLCRKQGVLNESD